MATAAYRLTLAASLLAGCAAGPGDGPPTPLADQSPWSYSRRVWERTVHDDTGRRAVLGEEPSWDYSQRVREGAVGEP